MHLLIYRNGSLVIFVYIASAKLCSARASVELRAIHIIRHALLSSGRDCPFTFTIDQLEYDLDAQRGICSSADPSPQSGSIGSLLSGISLPATTFKFPVQARREFAAEFLGKPPVSNRKRSSQRAQSVEIPCKFPWIREFLRRGRLSLPRRGPRASAPTKANVV